MKPVHTASQHVTTPSAAASGAVVAVAVALGVVGGLEQVGAREERVRAEHDRERHRVVGVRRVERDDVVVEVDERLDGGDDRVGGAEEAVDPGVGVEPDGELVDDGLRGREGVG